MKTIASLLAMLAAIAVLCGAYAQTPETNASLNSSSATNTAPTNQDETLPIIEFVDVPITKTIDTLARTAGINYILAPNLFQTNEPILTFRLKNMSARGTLNRMLNLHNLALNENSVTHVARITHNGQPTNVIDASLLDTNNSPFLTNGILPAITFQAVPLDYALETLIGASGINAELDPRLLNGVEGQFVEQNGVTVLDPNVKQVVYSTNKWFNPMPTISLHWENLTARQALIALCENYDLTVVKNGTNGVVQIIPIAATGRR